MSSIAKPQRQSLGTLIGGAAYGRAFRRIEPALDADAAKYLAAVESADKQVLEDGVKRAVSAFVRACKADGNWDAIKASCILCGARTLAGALVPLKGTAPTNYNFVGIGTDYTRDNGLQGDGSTKYLDSNRAGNADPQDDFHAAVYVTQSTSLPGSNFFGTDGIATAGATNIYVVPTDTSDIAGTNRKLAAGNPTFTLANQSFTTGLKGSSRASSSAFTVRSGGSSTSHVASSSPPTARNVFIFGRNDASSPPLFLSDATFAFYSIGEAIDLAALDSRVSTLVAAIGAAV